MYHYQTFLMLFLTVAWNFCLDADLTMGVGRSSTDGAAFFRGSVSLVTALDTGVTPEVDPALKTVVDKLARLGLMSLFGVLQFSLFNAEVDTDLLTSTSDIFLLGWLCL